MSLLSDASICPDCRTTLDPALTCPGCGLALRGPLAVALWEHLQQADRLIGLLRNPSPIPSASPTAGLPVAPPLPAPPARRPSGLSVPVVLLGLGALCVLVAAVVFVAVTWGSLGLAGRTAVMVGVTGLAGAAAVLLTRRGLRGGAETLWSVTHVLLVLDVLAAAAADLLGLGDLSGQQLAAGLGSLLLLSSLAVATWAGTTAVPRLHGMVLLTGLGALLLTAAVAWTADASLPATALSLPLLAASTALVARAAGGRLVPHAYAVASVAAVSWLVLVGHGLDRSEEVTATVWWQELLGWPLLAAAAVAALGSVPRQVPAPVRSLAAGAALGCLALLAVGGSASEQTKVLVCCAVVTALAAVAGLAPRVWAWPAGLMTGLGVLVVVPAVLLRPFGVTEGLPTTARATGTGLDLGLPATTWELSPWTAAVLAAVAAVCLLALVHRVPGPSRVAGLAAWTGTAPVLLGLGLVTWYVETGPRLLPAAAAWAALLVLAAALSVLAVRRADRDVVLVCCLALDAYLVAVGLRLTAPSHLLVALLAGASAAVLAVASRRCRPAGLGGALVPVLSGSAAALGLLAVAQGAYLLGGTGDAAGITLALAAAALGLAAARVGRTRTDRATLEVLALLAGVLGTALADDRAAQVAVATVVGSAVVLVSVLRTDREQLSWLGSAFLALAMLGRIDAGATAPELVALPAAALLVAAGVRRLLTDAGVSSWRVLTSGLALGLAPSLLGTLQDPVSVRGVLLAAAGLGFVVLGVQRRWAAPFAAGALVVAVTALLHLGPVAAALPRWISLGSVGVALLLVGITWEARRRDAGRAEKYLTALH